MNIDEIRIVIGADASKLKAAGDAIDNLKKKEKSLGDEVKKTSKSIQQQASETERIMESLQKKIAGAFAISTIKNFVKEIVNTRAEFQTFASQLETALGSKSAAQNALSRIVDFAKKTPESVKDITEVFVKLANRGITPTNSQLQKMGDLASALGKPMSQLNEAVLDINNPERWKELGVQVQTNGNKITGTFKGVTQTFDRTTEGALKMVETFGAMNGVAGGMENRMKTLGGAMSNFGDSVDALENQLGKTGEGGLFFIISKVTNAINDYTDALARTEDTNKKIFSGKDPTDKFFGFLNQVVSLTQGYDLYGEVLGETDDKLSTVEKAFNNVTGSIEKQNKEAAKTQALHAYAVALVQVEKEERLLSQEMNEGTRELKKRYIEATRANLKATYEDTLKSINSYSKGVFNSTEELKKQQAQIEKEIDLLDSLRKKLRDLQITEKELSANELEGEAKSEALFEQKKIRIDNEFADQKKKIEEEVHDRNRQTEALILLEKIKTQEIVNLTITHGQELKAIREKQAQEEIEHAHRVAEMQIELKRQDGETDSELYRYKREALIKYYDDRIKIEKDAKKKEELALEEKVKLGELDQAEKNRLEKINKGVESEEQRHTIEMMRLNEAGEDEILQKQIEIANEKLKALKESNTAEADEILRAENEVLELETKYNNLRLKNNEEVMKKITASINEVLQVSLQAEQTRIDNEIAANNMRITNEDKVIETQRVLAAKGYANSLAQEEKHRDDLVKQNLANQKKLKRIKELEIFLNAVAKFTEENPKTAVIKALGVVTASEVASIAFAEQGGIVGNGMAKWKGQSHRSGRDRMAIVEDGEVIVPKLKAQEMGITTPGRFQSFIKTPFKNKIVTSGNIMQVNNNAELVKEVRSLQEIIRNKKELSVSWEGLDMRLSELENGIKKTTVVKRNLF